PKRQKAQPTVARSQGHRIFAGGQIALPPFRRKSPMRLGSLLCLAGLVACSAAPASKSGPDPLVVRAQLDSLDAQFNRWVSAGQVDSIVSRYYAPDAILLAAGSAPVRGTDAIRAVYEGFFKAGNVRGHIQLSSVFTADSIA